MVMRAVRALSMGVGLGLLTGAAFAATPDLSGKSPYWIEDKEKHCWAANPDPADGETIQWTGGCDRGLLSGDGTLTWYLAGMVVGRDIGTFKDGQLSGKGSILFSDGARYDGNFPGQGVLTTPEGRKFPAESTDRDPGWSVQQINPNEVIQ
jgi:hypothetical protein